MPAPTHWPQALDAAWGFSIYLSRATGTGSRAIAVVAAMTITTAISTLAQTRQAIARLGATYQ
jgi:hypothetical protein